MQTKKRAKSVSFGKKETPKEKPEPKEHKVVAHPKPKEEETKIEIETVTTEVAVLDAPEEEVEEKVITKPEPEEEEAPQKEEPEEEDDISFDEKELEEELPKEKSAFSDDNYQEEKGGKSNFFLYFLIVALVSFVVGLLCMAGFDYVSSNKTDISSFLNAPTSTPAPSKKVTPSPTPVKAVDLSAYNIQVLNGSGVKGQAAKVREGLVGEGFKVASSGNAATQDYEKTELAVKKSVDAGYAAKLKAYLEKESYTLEETTLPESAKTDVVITIGQ